jgi:hypothetical protein
MDGLSREYALLDWLVTWRPARPGQAPTLIGLFNGAPPTADMDLWLETLRDLQQRRLLEPDGFVSGIFPSPVRITARGRAETDERHRRRDDPARRRPACREAFLRWAYAQGGEAVRESEFLTSPAARYEGGTFTEDEMNAALRFLENDGMIIGLQQHAMGNGGPMILRPTLTPRGHRYVESAAAGQAATYFNTVNIFGNNQAPLNVGNRDVNIAGGATELVDESTRVCATAPSHTSGAMAPNRHESEPWQAMRWRNGHLATHLAFQRLREVSSPFQPQRLEPIQPTEIRIGWRITCPTVPAHLLTRSISLAFLKLLGGSVMSPAIARLADITDLVWQRYADNGRTGFNAVLDHGDAVADPVAWARFNPTLVDEVPMFGREAGCADVILAIRYRERDGTPRHPSTINEWHETLTNFIKATNAVGEFLSADLGLILATEPPTRMGLAISTKTNIGELVDPNGAKPVPGTTVSQWFNAAARTDPSGPTAADVAADWIAALCDDALHLDDYEPMQRP